MIYIFLTTVPERLQLWSSIKSVLEHFLNQKTNKEYYGVRYCCYKITNTHVYTRTP